VAFTGLIGFVGLMVPHIMRLLVGPDHRRLLPASALFGALLLLIADTVARTAMAPAEIPVGIITAAAGGPFFLYLLRRRKGA
jgi:iron complex transport system permease protein